MTAKDENEKKKKKKQRTCILRKRQDACASADLIMSSEINAIVHNVVFKGLFLLDNTTACGLCSDRSP